ncbi:MAG TPA: hypothetical protein DCY13_11420, partial [Verrucomicrobiales bacterium]|nr:hypothetical protein [Verrucomicrobiales bacterium]
YYQNLATTVYLFRRDAEAYYGFNEQQVFDRALELYRKALELTPGSFEVANDLAQTYYGITPFRQEDAMSAWRDALELATTEAERQGVYIHFARLEIRVGHFSSASNHLNRVTIPEYKELKNRLFRLIESKQSPKPDAGPDPAAEPSQP